MDKKISKQDKKISKQDKIESDNLIEEAAGVFDTCTRCGKCKGICPTFKVLLEERVSARGMGEVLSEKVLEKVVYECTLCKACEETCPLHLKICDAVLKAREALVLKGKGSSKNEDLVNSLAKKGRLE